MAANEKIEAILQPLGLPLAYRQFKPYKNKPVPAPPYIVYLIASEESSGADGQNLIVKKSVTVELYTEKKDTATETAVENALSQFELTKYEDYITTEALFQVSYEFVIFEKIRR